MQSIIKIHAKDNVAVALCDLAAGDQPVWEGQAIALAQDACSGAQVCT
ncbi:Uncharacterised protein [Serratia fonticola]|uniref:Uncharacterized protein n=1 Tax=Serratia fonticola TaxID=47917 RepID=A0A4U9W8A2_SERFO|nr:Uncharacterised protein [Serratia fonticola]